MSAPPRIEARRLPAWTSPVATGLATGAMFGAIALLDPARRAGVSFGCPFRLLTGLDCPGCGATRSLYALTQGDVALAADHNVMLVVFVPILIAVWGVWFVRRVRHGWTARAPQPPARVSLGVAGLLAVFWVVRNLPWWPFSWLASTPSG